MESSAIYLSFVLLVKILVLLDEFLDLLGADVGTGIVNGTLCIQELRLKKTS